MKWVERKGVIPPESIYYLSEIAAVVRDYHAANEAVAQQLRLCQHLETAAKHAEKRGAKDVAADLKAQVDEFLKKLNPPEGFAEFRRFGRTVLEWRVYLSRSWQAIHGPNHNRILSALRRFLVLLFLLLLMMENCIHSSAEKTHLVISLSLQEYSHSSEPTS